ncbi:MAG: IS66 family transposase, partial [Marinifilaceae bacterium]
IHKTLQSYSGTIHTDGYSTYRKFGSSEDYPDIMRISCIQHCKRKFIDIKEDIDAAVIIDLFNELYRYDHKHRMGCDGWTEDDHLRYRQEYAPPIFARLRAKLTEINSRPTLLPKSEMAEAVKYALTEIDSMENYIKSGYYNLDTNNIERINRYISLSRKNSLFAGSHAGAKRMALLYSLACSCRENNINTLEYFTDILNNMGSILPNAPQEVFRNMLPDKWTKKSDS